MNTRGVHLIIPVGSVATSMSLTVLAVNTHPDSGQAGGLAIEMFGEH